MAKARLLAFLLCDDATRDRNGKVTLHGLFDRIVAPKTLVEPVPLYVYYRVVVSEPCDIVLRVLNPKGNELPEASRRDSLTELGPMQTVWSLSTSSFGDPGDYRLELWEHSENSTQFELAHMRLIVEDGQE